MKTVRRKSLMRRKTRTTIKILKNDLLVDLLILTRKSFAVSKKNKKQRWLWIKVRENQQTVTKARKQISRAYHPYDLLTGNKQDSGTVGIQLKESLDQIREAADHLPDRCKDKIEKA
nr:hypothetical protein [uncultured Desulfobacter sp.]